MQAKVLWKKAEEKGVATGVAHAGLTLLLSAGKIGGLYGPWALAAVALSGGRGRGVASLLGAALGAYLFYDFPSGLRLAASAVLIFCANMAFADMKITQKPYFAPALSAVAMMLVQSVYLVGHTARHWALCFSASMMAAAAAILLGREEEAPRLRVVCVMAAVVCAAAPLTISGFSPGRMAAIWLVLVCAHAAAPAHAALIGAGVGLAVDLAFSRPALLMVAALGVGGWCGAVLRRTRRIVPAALMVAAVAVTVLGQESDYAAAMIYEALCGGVAYLALPRRWLPAAEDASAAPVGEREGAPSAVPAMARAALREGAEAYRALYDELLRGAPSAAAENPSVIFDGAAEAVCRGCVLAERCWQAEYDVTFSAFNDAVTPILRRGRAEASDFPLHFASRCVRFTELRAAIDRGTYAYLLRRQYRSRLGSVRSLAREQYAQMSEMLPAAVPDEGEIRLHCRVGTSLRAKDGERLCGDQLAVFTVGSMLYLLLSDGMGSGEAAHAESAMTVRLLRKFLKAGIDPKPALKTLNTALTLRCAEGGGFTTIDLLALDRSSGEATLYKYGAAPTYVKRGVGVMRVAAGSLPAGLQGSGTEPESSRLHLEEGALVVMVSDGLLGSGDGAWISEGLARWSGMDAQDLSQQIVAESRRHGGLQDDCAVLVLQLENSVPDGKKRV